MTRPIPRRRAATLALICLSTFSLACKDDAQKPDGEGPSAPADGEPNEAKLAPSPAMAAGPLPEVAPATTDSAAVADHGQVVATVQLPTGSQLSDLSPIIDKFAPGTSPLLRMQFSSVLGQALGMQKFNGAKLSGPLSLIAVEPSLADKPLAVLVEVEDAEALGAQDSA